MFKKLRISLIFSNLVMIKTLNSNHRMHNLCANFVRILEVCKQYSQDLVSDFTVSQYINKINHKPIGRIKYALA